jgi:pimeloyl-ACP methyl ester carboxylesterase
LRRVAPEVTNTGSARRMLIKEAGAREVSVKTAGSISSALLAGSGSPLLLLHGFNAAGGLVWWPVLPTLSSEYRVVAPDLPGLGESAALSDRPSPPLIVEWLNDVVEQCFDDPITLVATSLSGGFGLLYAARHPERLRAVILTDAQGLAAFRPPPGFFIWTTLNRLRPSPAATTRLTRYLIHDQEHVRRLHGSLWDLFLGYMVSQIARREIREAMGGYASRPIARPVPTSLLEDMGVPVGLIWGRHDRPFPISIAEDVNSRFGWPLEVIDEAGHLPYMERPSEFTIAVDALASHG